ncbi:NAD(P)/FAD-dependent oxidoreductase [Sanguibacter hominis ATCC BAA-789]|uniref:NAD(P)/FAD-dependent oxidoreductase n=1 Tax=Sanguibacter hominis ATCC BAA-789 TaxID=1312740 RepID=A0A9X5FCF2_9MICO|nr:NAD(P)/FAD-dependent oxidoreductase [Sanguibacter hominis]NKX92167.1 NAD(P)/FAD-dependent oxidoreductase [Sanguibacter hominis ATCC BAA-789]
MEDTDWDAIILGGGAAGLATALMLGRALRRTLVIDAGSPRNRFASHMHGVLGHDGVPPQDLLARGREEVARYGVEVRPGRAARVDLADDGVVVTLDDGGTPLTARALVLATGMTDVLPDVPGLAERWGSGVLHCPYCHGWEVRGQRLGVLAASPLSPHQAELVRQWSDHVTFFTAGLGDPLDADVAARLRARGVAIEESAVAEVLGDGGAVTGVRLADGRVVELDALFTGAMAQPHDGAVAHLGLDRADTPVGSFLAVDAFGKTSAERIWAAGNVVDPGATVPMSSGAGARVGGMVNMALVADDAARALAEAAA